MNIPTSDDLARAARKEKNALIKRMVEAYRQRMEELRSKSAATVTVPDLTVLGDYRVFTKDNCRGIEGNSMALVHKGAELSAEAVFRMSDGANLAVVGAKASIAGGVIKATGKMAIVVVGDAVRLGKTSILTADRKSTVIIGKGTTWNTGAMGIVENDSFILVADMCMFSSEVDLRTSDSHPIYDRETGERINPAAGIIVDNNVWLGRAARVNKGVHLGEGSVIGQASIVTKATEPYCIYAGTPARLIRRNVEWRRSLKEGPRIEVAKPPHADKAGPVLVTAPEVTTPDVDVPGADIPEASDHGIGDHGIGDHGVNNPGNGVP